MIKDPVTVYPQPITIANAIAVNQSQSPSKKKDFIDNNHHQSKQSSQSQSLTVPPCVAPKDNCAKEDQSYGFVLKLFYIVSTLASIWIFSNAHPKYEQTEEGTKQISEYFRPKVEQCCSQLRDSGQALANHGLCPLLEEEGEEGNRMLRKISTRFLGDEGIFDAFLNRPDIICYLSFVVVSFILIWFQLLQNHAKPVVITTEAFKMAAIVFCTGSIIIGSSGGPISLILFVATAGYVTYVYKHKDNILKAADVISHSTLLVRNNASMAYKLLGLKIVYSLQTGILLITLCTSYEIVEVKPFYGSCYFVSPEYLRYINTFQIFVWIWTVWTLDMIRLMIVASITGSNYFGQTNNNNNNNNTKDADTLCLHNNQQQEQPLTFSNVLQRAVGKQSFGTLAFAGLVTSFLNIIRKRHKRCYIWCGPQVIILIVVETILCLFGDCILHFAFVLTKFSVVLHSFTGKSLLESGKHCHEIMRRRFVGGFVTEISSNSVLWFTSVIFSLLMAMISWSWIDAAFHCTSFDDMTYLLVFILLALFFTNPVYGILFVISINSMIQRAEIYQYEKGEATYQHVWVPPLAATFVGFVTKLLFTYMSGLILDTIDTMIVCFAIDEDNGVKGYRSKTGFAMIVKDMNEYIQAEPVAHFDIEADRIAGDNKNANEDANGQSYPIPSAPRTADI